MQVRQEIEMIERLFSTYRDLLEHARQTEPNLIELTALASVLHSFYTGLENIFQAIAKQDDSGLPDSAQWHRDLLWQMARVTMQRPAALSSTTASRLLDYLSFRHFYRHGYSFFLEWNELTKLVQPLPEVWAQTRHDLETFLNAVTNEPES
jgi:hypothetical protein